MKKRNGFTLMEAMISVAIVGIIIVLLVSLMNLVTKSASNTEDGTKAVWSNSSAKQLLAQTFELSSEIEILKSISSNDLSSYTSTLTNDSEYSYLFTIDGTLYYRGAYAGNTGKVIPMFEAYELDLLFSKDEKGKLLEIAIEVATKGDEPYKIDDELFITPINFNDDEVIKDNRTDKTQPSNIVRFKEDRELSLDVEEEDLEILSVVAKKETTGLPYDVEFFVTQEPRSIQLINISSYLNKSIINKATKASDIFTNNLIKQANFIKLLNTTKTPVELVVTIKGNNFIDGYGNGYVAGTLNEDGSRDVLYTMPLKAYTEEDSVYGVSSLMGRYLPYDFKINTELPKPEIVRFEYRAEDNTILYQQSPAVTPTIPYTLKTYINNNDIIYSKFHTDHRVGSTGTSATYLNNASPMSIRRLVDGSVVGIGTGINTATGYYSTINLPLSIDGWNVNGEFYPNYTTNNNQSPQIATVTFKGVNLYAPNGALANIPESEKSKLNGLEEVSTKLNMQVFHNGNPSMLDGEPLPDGEVFNAHYFSNSGKFFIPGYRYQGVYYVTVEDQTKMYSYIPERTLDANTAYFNYHKILNTSNRILASGLQRIWVDGYEDGAWVGGNMREDVSGEVVVTIPYDKYDEAKAKGITLNAIVYGSRLVSLPSYSSELKGFNTDTGVYRDLGTSAKKVTYSQSALSSIKDANGNTLQSFALDPDVITHFALLNTTDNTNATIPYQVRIEKSYPYDVRVPAIENIKVVDSSLEKTVQKQYINDDGIFSPSQSLRDAYGTGSKTLDIDIAFSGSKIAVGTSRNPAECTEFTNSDVVEDKSVASIVELSGLKLDGTYYVHLYDYSEDLYDTYMITPVQESKGTVTIPKRDTVVYDLQEELNRDMNDDTYYERPFLPQRSMVHGAAYGFGIDNGYHVIRNHFSNSTIQRNLQSILNDKINETSHINLSSSTDFVFKDKAFYIHNLSQNGTNTPLPYEGGANSKDYVANKDVIIYNRNLAKYKMETEDGQVVTRNRMYYRSTKSEYYTFTIGNNLNVMPTYNIAMAMTPVQNDLEHNKVGTYNTDDWVGNKAYDTTRKGFDPKNVKLDTTGFSVQIFNDRVYSYNYGLQKSFGRPGTIATSNYDIALVDTDKFAVDNLEILRHPSESTGGSGTYPQKNANLSFKYDLKYDNKKFPTTINTNDVVGYGFSLIEQGVDRERLQAYFGPSESSSNTDLTVTKDDRKVSVMFYIRQFYYDSNDSTTTKGPISQVKICDLEGFNIKTTQESKDPASEVLYDDKSAEVEMLSQGVNFVVDVKTTYDGTTLITRDNYESMMKNNFIDFEVIELDINDKPTGVVHHKRYSFADVFGSIRTDDYNSSGVYNELNLILNQRARDLATGANPNPVRLSVGYGVNWGLIGLDGFKISR